MSEVSIIGLDIAKYVFQAHGADAPGRVMFRKRLSRGPSCLDFFAAQPPCLVALEACGGAHHWARRACQAWPYGAADPARLREAVCQAAEERRGRCRGDLRSGAAPEHALRGGEERTAAGDAVWCSGPATCWCGSELSSSTRSARPPRRIRLDRTPRGRRMSAMLADLLEEEEMASSLPAAARAMFST